MDEILQKLLQSELLSEETKTEISEQWTAAVEAYKTKVRTEVSEEVRLELSEQWLTERDELVEKVEAFVKESLAAELQELQLDTVNFRDLEVEAAEKIVEAKHQMAKEVAEELDQLVDKLDQFLEIRLAEELQELQEDIEIVKQNEFGRQIYEAFAETFAKTHSDEDSAVGQLRVMEAKLRDATAALEQAEEERNLLVREAKLEKLLAPLTGKKREQMEMVLKGVDTERLEESYKFFIGRILKEEKEEKPAPLTETVVEKRTTVVTGDDQVVEKAPVVNEDIVRARRLAGLK